MNYHIKKAAPITGIHATDKDFRPPPPARRRPDLPANPRRDRRDPRPDPEPAGGRDKFFEEVIAIHRENFATLSALRELATYDPTVRDFYSADLEEFDETVHKTLVDEQESGSTPADLDAVAASRVIVWGARRRSPGTSVWTTEVVTRPSHANSARSGGTAPIAAPANSPPRTDRAGGGRAPAAGTYPAPRHTHQAARASPSACPPVATTPDPARHEQGTSDHSWTPPHDRGSKAGTRGRLSAPRPGGRGSLHTLTRRPYRLRHTLIPLTVRSSDPYR